MGGSRLYTVKIDPPKTRLCPSFCVQTSSHKVSHDFQWVQGQAEGPSSNHLCSRAGRKKGYRLSRKSALAGILQSALSRSKAREQMEAGDRFEPLESIPGYQDVQDGDTRIHPSIPQSRGVGHVDRPPRRLFPYTYTSQVSQIPAICPSGQGIPVQGSTVWSGHCPTDFHKVRQRSQAHGLSQGHSSSHVFGRLADSRRFTRPDQSLHSGDDSAHSRAWLDHKPQEVGTSAHSDLHIRGLSVRLKAGPCQAHSGQMVQVDVSDLCSTPSVCHDCKRADVAHWVASLNGKASSPRATPNETIPVVSQTSLEISRVSQQTDSMGQSHEISSPVVDRPSKCPKRVRFAPQGPQRPNVYRRLKRRLGVSIRRSLGKRPLVACRDGSTHKRARAQGSPVVVTTLPKPMCRTKRSRGQRQLISRGLYQQARGHSLGSDVCPPLAIDDLVQPSPDQPPRQTHSRLPECPGGLSVEVQTDSIDRMVPTPSGGQTTVPEVVYPSPGPVCHQTQPQISSVCVPSSRSTGVVSGCPSPRLDKPSSLCLPADRPTTTGRQQIVQVSLSADLDSSGLARHELVLGPDQSVPGCSDQAPSVPTPLETTNDTRFPQQPSISQSARVVGRSQSLQEKGFSEEVAKRIAAPQRASTRTMYQSKWSIFQRWCRDNSVDISSVSIKEISDFFWFLFKDKNRCPSTIEGYRAALADNLGSEALDISHSPELSRLLTSFHRDRPKASRTLPSWNLSLVLHVLTQAPFEPLRKVDLKFLTFKTVFLLALASGKRRSEIHAWIRTGVSNLGDWHKVSIVPSISFIAKNQLASQGAQCVAPVVIPALAHTLHEDLSDDRTLCPVRALRYYLDRTDPIRANRKLLFLSFKKVIPRTLGLAPFHHGLSRPSPFATLRRTPRL